MHQGYGNYISVTNNEILRMHKNVNPHMASYMETMMILLTWNTKVEGKNEVIGLPSYRKDQVQELLSNHSGLPPIALANLA